MEGATAVKNLPRRHGDAEKSGKGLPLICTDNTDQESTGDRELVRVWVPDVQMSR
jgi:hypothetical protein